MKKSFAKALVLALMLALVLSGCNLIEVDAKMQADEDIAKISKAYSKAVAAYDGGEVTIGEAMGSFNSYYNEMAYMYNYYFGYEMTHDDVHGMIEEVLAELVRSEISAAKFDEAYTLTEDELSIVEGDAQYSYDESLAVAMDSAEGKTEEQKAENARVLLYENGYDYDSIYGNALASMKAIRMEDILREEITEVSDEELMTAYEERVIEQEGLYTDGSSFENAMTGSDEIVCWQPEGYRTVKHILVMPSDELKNAYSDAAYALESSQSDLEILEADLFAAQDDDIAEGERTVEEIQVEIDAVKFTIASQEAAVEEAKLACLDEVQGTTGMIYARLEAGEAFEDLIAEYGEDPGMQNEPTKSRGYYVSDASVNWEVNFRDAAMALENVGDYTLEPVVSGSGVHIIQYASDVPAGMVDFEEVREALYEDTLMALQDAHCEEIISTWVAAANPRYDVEGFEAVFE